MRRRDISKALFASSAGSVLLSQNVDAQTCSAPCYVRTQAEMNAGVTPTDSSYPPGNILRYGTNTAPGATDMTAALQAALNVGGAVYIPNGTYLITASCQMKTTSQLIYGDGQLSILITKTDIETLYSSTNVFGVVIRDINFNNTFTGGFGGPTHFHVHFGINASGCTVLRCGFNTSLAGTVISTAFHAGLWFEGANLNSSLDCTYGMAQILMGSTDSTIRGGYVYAFAFQYAIKIISSGEVVVKGIRGILGGSDKGCIWITGPGYINKIIDNYFGGSLSTINIGEGVRAENQQMLQICNNTFHEVDKIGVHLVNPASGCVISGNTFWAGDPKQNDPTFATPGYQDIYVESSVFGASDVIIMDNVCNRFNGPVEGGMSGIGKSNAIEVKTFPGVANNIIRNNTVSGARYYSPSIVDANGTNSIGDNAGAPFTYTWTPIDLSGAGLTFTSVTAKYIRDAESITLWCAFTFPATTSGAGVTIGGLPVAPAAGMSGAAGSINTNSASAQKVKFSPGNTFFFLTDIVDAQQTNATCSGKYFNFVARYLY